MSLFGSRRESILAIDSTHLKGIMVYFHTLTGWLIVLSCVWVFMSSLVIHGSHGKNGKMHWVSDGFANDSVAATSIHCLTSHFVAALRVMGILTTNLHVDLQWLFLLAAPFNILATLVVLRYDRLTGWEHTVLALFAAAGSILFHWLVTRKLYEGGVVASVVSWATLISFALVVLFALLYALDRQDANAWWSVAGSFEFIAITGILVQDWLLNQGMIDRINKYH